MRVTRHHRPLGSLLAAALVLGAGSLPAAAQSGAEAVVCVGSETRTLQTNPIRRVYTEDMEIVYRIGVDIGQRDQMERTLSSELGSYPEVWCAWSDPGDDHAVIISYTGVIRQDLTVDPEDPRFQAFSVGFGTDFDAAESQATTINQRFSSQNDGSGFEVLLRETWGVAEGVVAGALSEGSARRMGRFARGERPQRAAGRRSRIILSVSFGIPNRGMVLRCTGVGCVQGVSPKEGERKDGTGTMEALPGPECFKAGGARGSTSSSGDARATTTLSARRVPT